MRQTERFDSLTSLRGLFILVIAFHNTMQFQPLFNAVPGSAFFTLFGGDLGNSMFFLLSGFGMAFGYRDRIQAHTLAFQDFLLKRLRKLYPMYLISNFAALVLEVVQYGLSAINLQKIVLTVLLRMGGGLIGKNPYNAPTWFLCTLLLCYVVFFFVSYICKTPTQYRCAIALGIVWGYFCMTASLEIPFCDSGSGMGLMNFFIGCALAEGYPLLRDKHRKWAAPAAFAALLFMLYLMLRYGIEIICGNVKVAFAFCVCPLIFYLAMAQGLCTKILQWKVFVFLGKISSSIFFWHLVVYPGFCVVWLAPGQTITERDYLVYFAVMIVWSILSHWILEFAQHHGKKDFQCIGKL